MFQPVEIRRVEVPLNRRHVHGTCRRHVSESQRSGVETPWCGWSRPLRRKLRNRLLESFARLGPTHGCRHHAPAPEQREPARRDWLEHRSRRRLEPKLVVVKFLNDTIRPQPDGRSSLKVLSHQLERSSNYYRNHRLGLQTLTLTLKLKCSLHRSFTFRRTARAPGSRHHDRLDRCGRRCAPSGRRREPQLWLDRRARTLR